MWRDRWRRRRPWSYSRPASLPARRSTRLPGCPGSWARGLMVHCIMESTGRGGEAFPSPRRGRAAISTAVSIGPGAKGFRSGRCFVVTFQAASSSCRPRLPGGHSWAGHDRPPKTNLLQRIGNPVAESETSFFVEVRSSPAKDPVPAPRSHRCQKENTAAIQGQVTPRSRGSQRGNRRRCFRVSSTAAAEICAMQVSRSTAASAARISSAQEGNFTRRSQ